MFLQIFLKSIFVEIDRLNEIESNIVGQFEYDDCFEVKFKLYLSFVNFQIICIVKFVA